jgi:hypothetical protein
MKALTAFICLAMSCVAQTTKGESRKFKPLGSAEFEANADRVAVYFLGREYRVDLSRLPLSVKDCPDPNAGEQCAAHPGAPCLECVTDWQPIAWDEPRQLFYMAASTDTGRNRPWIIFVFDLRSKLMKRIGFEEGGGFGGGAVSSSGRYLAYIGYDVCGMCCGTSRVMLIDAQTGASGRYKPRTSDDDERANILALRWVEPSKIQFDFQVVREPACRAGQDPQGPSTGSIRVEELLGNR